MARPRQLARIPLLDFQPLVLPPRRPRNGSGSATVTVLP